MSEDYSQSNGKHPVSAWTKTAYVLSNDITAVALYRLVAVGLGTLMISLVAYYGNRTVVQQDDFRRDISSIQRDAVRMMAMQMAMQVQVDDLRQHGAGVDARLNAADTAIAALGAQMNFVTRRSGQ